MNRLPTERRGRLRTRTSTWLLALVLMMLALLMAGCTEERTAEGRYSGTLITHGDHTLAAEHPGIGDVFVAGGTTTQPAGAQQRGSVYVLGGVVALDGGIDGDVVALGGRVSLREEAVIGGDLVHLAGRLDRAPDATVRGEVVGENEVAALIDAAARPSTAAERFGWVAVSVVLMGGLSWLIARWTPRLSERTSSAAAGYPLVCGALGTLILVMAPALLAAMAFTLFLIPVAAVIAAGLALAMALGMVALGRSLGTAIARRRAWDCSPVAATVFGSGVLVLALRLVSLVPLAGVIVMLLTIAVGSGSVFLTGFGTRSYSPPDDDRTGQQGALDLPRRL